MWHACLAEIFQNAKQVRVLVLLNYQKHSNAGLAKCFQPQKLILKTNFKITIEPKPSSFWMIGFGYPLGFKILTVVPTKYG